MLGWRQRPVRRGWGPQGSQEEAPRGRETDDGEGTSQAPGQVVRSDARLPVWGPSEQLRGDGEGVQGPDSSRGWVWGLGEEGFQVPPKSMQGKKGAQTDPGEQQQGRSLRGRCQALTG